MNWIRQGKTRIILRTDDGKILLDTLVDNGSKNVINLPAELGLKVESVRSTTGDPLPG